jgi:hypothetical protein
MITLKYVKFDKVSIKNHPEFNESWVQERIADDPSILGMGDLILKDKEVRGSSLRLALAFLFHPQ